MKMKTSTTTMPTQTRIVTTATVEEAMPIPRSGGRRSRRRLPSPPSHVRSVALVVPIGVVVLLLPLLLAAATATATVTLPTPHAAAAVEVDEEVSPLLPRSAPRRHRRRRTTAERDRPHHSPASSSEEEDDGAGSGNDEETRGAPQQAQNKSQRQSPQRERRQQPPPGGIVEIPFHVPPDSDTDSAEADGGGGGDVFAAPPAASLPPMVELFVGTPRPQRLLVTIGTIATPGSGGTAADPHPHRPPTLLRCSDGPDGAEATNSTLEGGGGGGGDDGARKNDDAHHAALRTDLSETFRYVPCSECGDGEGTECVNAIRGGGWRCAVSSDGSKNWLSVGDDGGGDGDGDGGGGGWTGYQARDFLFTTPPSGPSRDGGGNATRKLRLLRSPSSSSATNEPGDDGRRVLHQSRRQRRDAEGGPSSSSSPLLELRFACLDGSPSPPPAGGAAGGDDDAEEADDGGRRAADDLFLHGGGATTTTAAVRAAAPGGILGVASLVDQLRDSGVVLRGGSFALVLPLAVPGGGGGDGGGGNGGGGGGTLSLGGLATDDSPSARYALLSPPRYARVGVAAATAAEVEGETPATKPSPPAHSLFVRDIYVHRSTTSASGIPGNVENGAAVLYVDVEALNDSAGAGAGNVQDAIIDAASPYTYLDEMLIGPLREAWNEVSGGVEYTEGPVALTEGEVVGLPTIALHFQAFNDAKDAAVYEPTATAEEEGEMFDDFLGSGGGGGPILAIPPEHYMESLGDGTYRSRLRINPALRRGTVLGADVLRGHAVVFDFDYSTSTSTSTSTVIPRIGFSPAVEVNPTAGVGDAIGDVGIDRNDDFGGGGAVIPDWVLLEQQQHNAEADGPAPAPAPASKEDDVEGDVAPATGGETAADTENVVPPEQQSPTADEVDTAPAASPSSATSSSSPPATEWRTMALPFMYYYVMGGILLFCLLSFQVMVAVCRRRKMGDSL